MLSDDDINRGRELAEAALSRVHPMVRESVDQAFIAFWHPQRVLALLEAYSSAVETTARECIATAHNCGSDEAPGWGWKVGEMKSSSQEDFREVIGNVVSAIKVRFGIDTFWP